MVLLKHLPEISYHSHTIHQTDSSATYHIRLIPSYTKGMIEWHRYDLHISWFHLCSLHNIPSNCHIILMMHDNTL